MRPSIHLLFLTASIVYGAEPKISWNIDLGEPVTGARPIWNGDAAEGVAVTLGSGTIVLLDAQGKRLSEMKLDARAVAPAMTGNLLKGVPALAAVDERGSVYAFNRNGDRMWKYVRNTKVGDFRMPVLADLSGDGNKSLLMEDWIGHVYAVDSGGRLRLELSGARSSPPAVADVNGDGKAELIVGDEDGHVICLTPGGDVLWVKQYPGKFGRSVPVVADADRDGRYEVYLTTPAAPTGLYALDAATGEKLWFAPSNMQAYQSIALVDLDGDGKDEILYGDKNTRLYCVDAKGHRLWDTQVDGHGIFFAPAVVDTPQGKRIFQIARERGVNGKTLYEIDAHGRLLGEYAVPGIGAGSPVLFRFKGETGPSMLVVPDGNRVICYKFPAEDKIAWPGWRNDLDNSGFVPAAHAVVRKPAAVPPAGAGESRQALLGSNAFAIHAPSGAAGVVRVQEPDGAVRVSLLPATGPRTSTAGFEASSPGTYDVQVRWMAASTGEGAAVRHYRYTLDADLKADRALLEDCRRRLQEFRDRSNRKELIDFLDTTAQAKFEQALRNRSGARFAEARSFYAYAQALASALDRLKPSGDLLLRPLDNPWITLDSVESLRAAPPASVGLRLSMLGNEYESAAVAISNLQSRPATVRVVSEAFDGPAKLQVKADRVLELREAPLVLTEAGVVTEDVLPLLGEGQTVQLGPGETRKVWLVFRSRELKPGVWHSRLTAADLLSPDAPSQLPVSVTVRALALPDGFTYRHCSWLYAASLSDERVRDATIRDAVSHGMNVFMIPAATVTVDRSGNVTGSDSALADKLLSEVRAKIQRGKVTFLINGSINVKWPEAFTAPPELADSALGNGLHWYVAHMKALGLDQSDYALYTQDEPGLMGKDAAFDRWVAEVKRIKRLEPDIWMYADPAGGADAQMLAPVADLIDIWAPDLPLLRDSKRGPDLDRLFRHAKAYWHYEPPGDSRTLDPQGYYRGKAWMAWKMGLTGGGFWVYSDSPFWNRYLRSSEYGTVYPSDHGPVTTRRWEASRDGSEDFELLTIVKQWALRRPDQPASKEALALIDEAVAFANSGPPQTHESRRLGMNVPDFEKWQQYKERLAAAAEALGQ